MNANWNDFNDADAQASFDLIPKGTIVPVRMTIKPGALCVSEVVASPDLTFLRTEGE